MSRHIYLSPSEVFRACCRLCLKLGLSLLTQSPAKGPEVPSSDRHRGHRVTGDSGVPVLLPWEMGWPCRPCHRMCLYPQFSGSSEQDSQSQRDTEDVPYQQVWAPAGHSFVLKTASAPQPLSLMSQGISVPQGALRFFVHLFVLRGCSQQGHESMLRHPMQGCSLSL